MGTTKTKPGIARAWQTGVLALAVGVVGCDDEGGDSTVSASGDAGGGGQAAAQLPPQGHEAVAAWLDGGDYLDWSCEAEPHAARSPSPHGINRICSNDVIASDADGSGEWPEGAAAVKELYDDDGATIVGYAVYLKTAPASDDGASWYWYEIVPSDHPAPHDDEGIVADGLGTGGPEQSICVSCHTGAGRDFVFTIVE